MLYDLEAVVFYDVLPLLVSLLLAFRERNPKGIRSLEDLGGFV